MKGPRSRRETRGDILSYLWCSGGSFRPDLAENVGLTEASVSRIVADLKAEDVVEESRRKAPYPGGPSAFLTLSNNLHVAAFEVSNNRVHVGVGTLAGDIRSSERYDLPDGSSAADVERMTARAIADLAEWVQRRRIALEQVSVSIPGYHPGQPANPVLALDPSFLAGRLAADLPDTPTTIANSILTRAVAHRLRLGVGHVGGAYLYVYAGHGVGAAIVDELTESGEVQPYEIGHMVLDPQGPACRCGHAGCLEAFVSTVAVAALLKVPEADLLAVGDRWVDDIRIPARTRAALCGRLARLGTAIGNALNCTPVRRVVVTGWPTALPEADRRSVLDGIDAALLGGAAGVDLSFASAGMGREPASGLALAAYSFIRRGGERKVSATDPADSGQAVRQTT